jgi:hypothetical protein
MNFSNFPILLDINDPFEFFANNGTERAMQSLH